MTNERAGRALVIHGPRDLRIEELAEEPLGPGDVRVGVQAGGICGSDIHYYEDGGFGTVRLRQPMILGHEVAGDVMDVGPEVTHLTPGDRVVVNPSLPCGTCRFCLAGQTNHCLDMRFYGSAMRMPHVQGAFRDVLVCRASQAVIVPQALPASIAAFAEPLAVCLHAVARAGVVRDMRVMVSGVGPIGALCILAARHAGARHITAVDVLDAPVRLAERIGADEALNVREWPQRLDSYAADKGSFDVVFEASGSGAALEKALAVAKPGAVIVQIGLGDEIPLPVSTLVSKEVSLRGTFRFLDEFGVAADLLASGAIDVRPLLTATVPASEAVRAFELARDRDAPGKVQLSF